MFKISHSKRGKNIIKIIIVFSGLSFIILSIIAALAFNVWDLGLGGLLPVFAAFIFGLVWLISTIIWLLTRRREKYLR